MIMRRLFVPIVALVAALAATLALAPAGTAAAPTVKPATASGSFNDVPPASEFYGDVAWLVSNGITKGYSDGGFHPAAPVSRQSMAAFLYRAKNPGTTAPACTAEAFKDVPADSQFCADINWLVTNKVTNGYSDGGFHPAAPVSRQSMAAFLYRLDHDGANAPGCSSAPFKDVPAGSQFCGAIAWLSDQDITGGYSDGGFHPGDAVSRQSMAAFLHRWAAPSPAVSVSRYVRTSDQQLMQTAGADDAATDAADNVNPRLHLLDIGAQTNSKAQLEAVGAAGVVLTGGTDIRLSYADLVTLLSAYIQGYAGAASGADVTIAIGTNSDGDFSSYTANHKGQDWWTEVVAPLRSVAPAGVTVVGANDIEPGFAATEAQAQNWKSAFLANSGAELILNGSADGCPTTFGKTTGTCNNGWTPAQLKALYSGSQVSALPQIYLQVQADQWANIAMASGSTTPNFVGTLTESAACGEKGCSWTPQRGWIALWDALTAAGVTPKLVYASDLAISS
jgi:hypothetical protein